ncbi:MAG: hypothetical protein NZ932_02730 [Candidatus Bathyarchaeota archaeon]|nr:hypothetical protein [Candidatus Bathyarchaeota archaeon]MDW8041146.1 hypothetical protein [Nitrososphaerota archaeon]
MDVSIRMVGLASTFFWILLVAFFASAAYSVKDLRLNFEKPQLRLTQEGYAVLSIPINIENGGFYNLGEFNLTTKVADLNGTKITEGSTLIPLIKKGAKIVAFHNLTFSVDVLLEKGSHYLFNDSSFAVAALISVKLAEVIPVQVSSNFSVAWGAPFYNFHLGRPTFEPLNFTHLRIAVPISFENHAPIDVNGEISLYMYNSEGKLVGQGESAIVAPQGALYTSSIVFYVQMLEITEEGFFEVYLSTPFLSYGPLVFPYG